MTTFDLAPLGYRMEEWFVDGDARSFAPVETLHEDGRWRVVPSAEAVPYRTRIVVVRPVDAERFDGTVAVEWFNVTAGFDAAPDWTFLHNELMRRGSAYIGVSAQRAGVAALTSAGERYASLSHPGDAFAFDVYADVGRLVRDATGAGALLAGLARPTTVVAIGESQSAFFLVTYVNAIDRIDAVYDGFLVHGRGGSSAPLSSDARTPARVEIRPDVRVPVVVVQAETDLMVLGSVHSRHPDRELVRVWEIAGAAHADTYTLAGFGDDGSLTPAALAAALAPTSTVAGMAAESPINSGPQQRYVLHAAFDHVARWASGGTAAPRAAALDLVDGSDPPTFATDEHGNVTGGVRTPWVDVPLARLSGLGQSGAGFARLFGRTDPFDAAKLAALYPSKDEYVARFTATTDRAIADGFLLARDRDQILGLAAASWDLAVAAAATSG